jgi:hypothetical protein
MEFSSKMKINLSPEQPVSKLNPKAAVFVPRIATTPGTTHRAITFKDPEERELMQGNEGNVSTPRTSNKIRQTASDYFSLTRRRISSSHETPTNEENIK